MTNVRVFSTHAQSLLTTSNAKLRTASTHVQAVLLTAQAMVRVSSIHVQVLLPTKQETVSVEGIHVQVLRAYPWMVSASDGMTAVHQLHTDGRWRPLYLIEQ
jgi:hypothetical protein